MQVASASLNYFDSSVNIEYRKKHVQIVQKYTYLITRDIFQILEFELCRQRTCIKPDKHLTYKATIYATQMSDCIDLQNLACAVLGLQNQNQNIAVVGMPSKKMIYILMLAVKNTPISGISIPWMVT